jgi:hypothetical protein
VTIQLASAIVGQLGPCAIAVEAPGIPTLPTELALLGCDVSGNAARAVVIEWPSPESQALLAGAAAHGSANALVIIPHGPQAASFEPALFAAGWRRHPGAMGLPVLAQWERGELPQACFYERAPGDYSGILNRQDTGSLGSIGRWALACERVRAGDHVLLLGPEAAEGRPIVEALSRATAVEVHGPGTGEQAPRGFDAVIAFDVPGAWAATIASCTRYLKLDGRLIVGWSDDNGDSPENWDVLEDALSEEFLIEGHFAQLPAQAVPQSVPLADIGRPGWQIAVATMNPIGGEAERAAYVHPAFGRSRATLVDFAAGYDNPWLYRTMVQMGERLTDDAKLARLAEYVIGNARPGSADQGAALAVLGYRVLENRADNVAPVLLGAMATYYDQGGDEPHVVRWRVSLAFLAGRLSELVGDREAAKLWYGRTASDDWKKFSTILATKAIGAAFFAGRIFLAEQDADAAWPWFQRGVDIALEAAGADHRKELGGGEGLLSFYLPELAEVIDMGSQCANALANRHLWARDPGLFWRQVDVKRFGLASWAIDVARENARLRQMLSQA